MFNKTNNFKYTAVFVCVGLFLSACGGGGGGDSGGGNGGGGSSTSQMTNRLNLSGTVDAPVGKNLSVVSNVSSLRSSITDHKWSTTQISGAPADITSSPRISDFDCIGATKVGGVAATSSTVGVTGTSSCQSFVIVPSSAKNGDWLVTNTAKDTNGNTASSSFTLKIKEGVVLKTGLSLIIPNVPQVQELGKITSLSASYTVNPGVKVDSVQYSWTQVDGSPVNLAGSNTATPSFIPKAPGEYVFRVTTTINSEGASESQQGDIVVVVSAASTTSFFDVSAGDVQVGKLGIPVLLKGTGTGNIDPTTVSYEWSQVSGPQQVVFANAKNLNASFIPEISGTYVFQLKASSSLGFKTSTTTVAIEKATGTTQFFIVSAGDVQLGQKGKITLLKGSVASGGTAPLNISYNWKQTSGPTVTLSNKNTLQASFIPVEQGDYTFELTGEANGMVQSSSTTISVPEVIVPVQPPVVFNVSAGDGQIGTIGSISLLKGVLASGTPAPLNITYDWKQTSGPTVVLSNKNSLQASFIPNQQGDYIFELTAKSDGVFQVSSTTVSVPVFFNISAGDSQVGTVGAVIALKATVTPNAANATYLWEQVSGPSVNLANPNSLQASFISSIVGNYEFKITAVSGGVAKASNTVVSIQ